MISDHNATVLFFFFFLWFSNKTNFRSQLTYKGFRSSMITSKDLLWIVCWQATFFASCPCLLKFWFSEPGLRSDALACKITYGGKKRWFSTICLWSSSIKVIKTCLWWSQTLKPGKFPCQYLAILFRSELATGEKNVLVFVLTHNI